MEKKDVISAIEKLMKENGLTQEELITFWNSPQEAPKSQEEPNKEYPFEVMYDDGTRSWSPQKDKKPWGIIFYGSVICLKNLEEKMPWKKAVDYCQQITIGKMKGSAGSKDFWEILKIQAPKKINELNEFISKLGGEKIEGSYWTSDQNDHNWAYFVLFSNSPKRPSMISAYFKSLKIAVRPILSLT